MGGYGSGRQGWLPVIEDGLKFDLRRLRQQGFFNPDAPNWSVPIQFQHTGIGDKIASVTMSYSTVPEDTWLRLDYTVTRDGKRIPVSETFELERFQQPFGGARWYLRCPQTGRRCQCLYLPPGATRFRSRGAFRRRLQYRSQQQAPFDRMLAQREHVAKKVLQAGPPDWRKKHRDRDFPPKPPWMRQATYDRHFAEWGRCELWMKDFLARYVERLGGL